MNDTRPMRLLRFADRIRTRLFTGMIRGSFRSFGSRSVIRPPASVHGGNSITIGDGVRIGRNAWLLAIDQTNRETQTAVAIGHGCSFGDGLFVSARSAVVIGDRVLAGRNVHISDHSHECSDPDKPVMDQGLTPPRRVSVGPGAWLGQGVVICPGVSIGENAVIGANSVVRSDIPAHCIAAGAPAKVIRMSTKH